MMSFMLELNIEGLTDAQGRAIERKCRERDAWPIEYLPPCEKRVWFRRRSFGPGLWLPESLNGRHLLSDEAIWDAPAWAMEPDLLRPFADAMRVLGEEVPQGFDFRATWVGSEVRHERVVSADQLAQLVLDSQLNEFTRYRVPARDAAG